MTSYTQLEKLLFSERPPSSIDKRNCLFLQSQVFRKTYVQAKKAIDDWLRKVSSLEISLNELKRTQKYNKVFT